MKKNILVLVLIFISSLGVFGQKIRTTAVFDADTSTRPKAGFYGIGVRSGNAYLVPATGTNVRLANYSLFTGLTTNYMSKWNGSGFVNSAVFESGGNVGIGTASPNAKLEVTGNIGLSPNIGSSRYLFIPTATDTYTGQLHIQSGAGSDGFGGAINLFGHSHATKPGWVTAGISVGAGTVGSSTEGRFTVNTQALGSGTDLFTVLRSGNVGIGTTNPSEKLTIASGNIKLNSLQFTSGEYRYIGTEYTTGNGNNKAEIRFAIDGGDTFTRLQFHTANGVGDIGERMRITSSGNVGIGTTTPDASAILHTSSTNKGVLITRGTTTQINAIASPANGLMVYNTTLNKLCVYENGTWKQVTTTNM